MESGTGWYLYAFLGHGDLPPLTGIDGRSPLEFIAEEGIAALASQVPLAEFGEQALRGSIEDPRWLEEKVRLHEAIVEAALSRGPLLPLKFGTIFLDPEGIRTVIRKNAPVLRAAIQDLRGKEEWGVKGLADRAALRAAALRGDPALLSLSGSASTGGPGQAFFLRKKIAESALAKSLEREEALARGFLAAIRETVVDLAASPALLPEAPRREEMIVFNLACLVRQERVATFLAIAEQWSRVHAGEGLRLVTSGPWPPYHFVPQLAADG